MKKKTFAVDIDGTITENGIGRINLDALSALRHLTKTGHKVIFVSGRSSIEGYLLSIFAGTTHIAVGENGGCITTSPTEHKLLGDKKECLDALDLLKSKIKDVKEKPVFPRMTEVVLERTFDIESAKNVIIENDLGVNLSDSQYAYHINSKGIDKAHGFNEVMKMLSITPDDVIAIGDSATDVPLFRLAKTSISLGNSSEFVKSQSSFSVGAKSGDGLIEALDKLAPTLSEA
ncbi:MAG: phosphoglycolate phosphatase [Nitrosopumilaceae archaeon]